MDIDRQRVIIRKLLHASSKGKASGLTSKVALKVALKRKNDAKDDRPSKKTTGQFAGGK